MRRCLCLRQGDRVEVTAADIAAATAGLSEQDKDDIRFQYHRVYNFALQQVNSIKSFTTELYPGVRLRGEPHAGPMMA